MRCLHNHDSLIMCLFSMMVLIQPCPWTLSMITNGLANGKSLLHDNSVPLMFNSNVFLYVHKVRFALWVYQQLCNVFILISNKFQYLTYHIYYFFYNYDYDYGFTVLVTGRVGLMKASVLRTSQEKPLTATWLKCWPTSRSKTYTWNLRSASSATAVTSASSFFERPTMVLTFFASMIAGPLQFGRTPSRTGCSCLSAPVNSLPLATTSPYSIRTSWSLPSSLAFALAPECCWALLAQCSLHTHLSTHW